MIREDMNLYGDIGLCFGFPEGEAKLEETIEPLKLEASSPEELSESLDKAFSTLRGEYFSLFMSEKNIFVSLKNPLSKSYNQT